MNSPTPDLLEKPPVDLSIWPLDHEIVFLNHGSFGSCPRPILEYQRGLRDRMEARPIQFLGRDLEALLDESRAVLAGFLGARTDNLVFVANATSGVNTVLRSLEFQPDDEVLVTDQEYTACRNALDYAAHRGGAKVVVTRVPFPFQSTSEVVDAVLAGVTPRTRLLLIDHVTSQTGMIMPLARIVEEMSARGIDTLVDGAHAPGMIPLNLEKLGAAYYTGNCHKWLCGPKASGFLYVRPDRQKLIRPLSISHGASSPRTDRSRFQVEFAWTGTSDPTPCLAMPEVLRYLATLLPGGWPAIMAHNRALALAARRIVCDALKISLPCPDECIGSLAAFPLPPGTVSARPISPLPLDPLQDQLRIEHSIEIPVMFWPVSPRRLIRFSAQLYNSLPQYRLLAKALAGYFP